MIISMHCQPSFSRDFSSCTSSVYFLRPICPPTEYFSSCSHSLTTPRRRRRLEDPIVSYASNYYASYPHGTTTAAAVTSITHPSSIPSTRPFEKEIDRKVLYCDLYNLLEIPESSTTTTNPIKSRRRTNFNEGDNIRRHHHHHHENERKRSTYHKEKKHSVEIKEKSMKTNEIYSRRSSPATKGFFRRVMRQYFCLTASMANNGYSS